MQVNMHDLETIHSVVHRAEALKCDSTNNSQKHKLLWGWIPLSNMFQAFWGLQGEEHWMHLKVCTKRDAEDCNGHSQTSIICLGPQG